MQRCPHCSEQIQDEAIFCRYCRRDVEPPLWLASMRRCPFCAEWIEEGLDTCPICRKELAKGPTTKVPPFTHRASPDFATELRQRVGITETRRTKPPDKPEPKPFEPEPSPEKTIKVSPVARPRRLETDLTGFRKGILDEPGGVDDLGGIQTAEVERGIIGKALQETLPNLIRRGLPVLLGGAVVVAIVALAMGPGQRFFTQMVTATPTDTPKSLPSPTNTPTKSITSPTPKPTTTLQLVATPTEISECILWDQVSIGDEGRVLCVYGEVKRWFASEDIPFVAIFSEDTGSFAFIDYTRIYATVRPGVCIMAQGYIEVMRGTRPFIDLVGTLEFCPVDEEAAP